MLRPFGEVRTIPGGAAVVAAFVLPGRCVGVGKILGRLYGRQHGLSGPELPWLVGRRGLESLCEWSLCGVSAKETGGHRGEGTFPRIH
jgi:hypothetical protein